MVFLEAEAMVVLVVEADLRRLYVNAGKVRTDRISIFGNYRLPTIPRPTAR